MSNQWIDINDYSRLKNISISTIRRRIKSGQVVHQFVDGKYFIQVTDEEMLDTNVDSGFKVENDRLRDRMARLQEELDDLKTLISVYESQNPSYSAGEKNSEQPPEIPS